LLKIIGKYEFLSQTKFSGTEKILSI